MFDPDFPSEDKTQRDANAQVLKGGTVCNMAAPILAAMQVKISCRGASRASDIRSESEKKTEGGIQPSNQDIPRSVKYLQLE